MTILEKIKFEEDWLSEVNLTKENIKIAFAGIRATALESQRWIPVSERLPEKLGMYLATIKIGEKSVLTFVDLKDKGRGERGFSYGTVIAWMPLPKPYEESEDKE